MAPITTDSRARLLDAALATIRRKGYAATTVDDLCAATQLSKGSFFHHLEQGTLGTRGGAALERQHRRAGEERAVPAGGRCARTAAGLHRLALRWRKASCPTSAACSARWRRRAYATHPAIREACRAGIEGHAMTLVPTIAEAKARHAPRAKWTPESLALFTQAALQGAFVVAKAAGNASATAPLIAHRPGRRVR